MKEQWVKAKEWWSNLAARERQALGIGGAILIIFLVYQCVWSPSINGINNMRKRIETQQKILAWMQSADAEIKKKEGHAVDRSRSNSPVALLSVLQHKIQQTGLDRSLTQLKQATNDSVEIHFQKVGFDKLVGVLTSIVKEQKVVITQFSATADSAPGTVNADIILKLA